MLCLSICATGSRDCALVPQLDYSRYSMSARQNADPWSQCVFVFQHMTVFPLERDFALNVTEDKPKHLAHHLHVQHFKIILPTMVHANACSNRTGFVMLVMPIKENIMLGKWNPAARCVQCGEGLLSYVLNSPQCSAGCPSGRTGATCFVSVMGG